MLSPYIRNISVILFFSDTLEVRRDDVLFLCLALVLLPFCLCSAMSALFVFFNGYLYGYNVWLKHVFEMLRNVYCLANLVSLCTELDTFLFEK